MKNEYDEFLPEGDYYCAKCCTSTKHEYSNNDFLSNANNPKRTLSEIIKRQYITTVTLSCIQCGNELT